MKFTVQVTVSRRAGVFDPEERVISQGIERFFAPDNPVQHVSIKRVFTLTISAKEQSEALSQASKVSEAFLCEPILEDYEVEVIDVMDEGEES